MTTLFVATTGGHLQQLDFLASRVPPEGEALWVTDENEQSRSLLADRAVTFVPYVGIRGVADVARCVPTAHRLWRERGVTRVISTGSGIALGYLPYLAARGVSCHYIESATRVGGPSLTGRLLQATPSVLRYTQYRGWAGRRWLYRGSVFDGFEAEAAPRTSDVGPIRVVVTVGVAPEFGFSRLIERLVPLLAADGELSTATGCPVEVLWQTGSTPTGHLPIAAHPFLPAARLRAAVAEADIVVSHAGTGSSLVALFAGRLPVLASRSPQLGETVDGHQSELGRELDDRGLALHRAADRIVLDDLIRALGSRVRRHTDPPPFELAS
ncbi:MAG: UDP-N-acetylglucosamine--N-acetylmuramyl-(Pentapeptide) pyrophosphoryl-undecaprenol [Blastococcus sp.]|jgi:UDP-N-acetylglucosamine--N-acetylmuramyl-(pentapeptide) pyrophosphoryl-undecaprenol N-acetylglucosamine transferase|nr:UDP-N-acetylglucosamine--N-acetylmuramyl-(Pentapeptide) pyrophosphoryl-undecaprenol [Blastococcus sp.]